MSTLKTYLLVTFGCKSCGIKPYIIITSYDIKVEGILDYQSNCTFEKKYLSCNSEPYQVTLDEDYTSCLITVPRLNQTLSANIQYNFMGDVSPVNIVIERETMTTIARSIVTSTDFITSLTNTITLCAIGSTLVTLVMKGYQIYTAHEIQRKAEVV